DALAYVAWLNQEASDGSYRLMSEAEWEYVARAGAQSRFPYGDDPGYTDLCKYANFAGQESRFGSSRSSCSDDFINTAPVGTKGTNALGVADMLGNALEWVSDCWNRNYKNAPETAVSWADGDCRKRVLRGGAWRIRSKNIRVARRYALWARDRFNHIGFRVAKSLPAQ
ncbi:MAG: SUMF1/EgtB/PvdO family nonheme iron enzyme, partial [Pseudomonadota bacterium]